MTMFDDPEIIKQAKKHALSEYPKESVGGVIGGKYAELVNVATNPEQCFEVAHVDGLEALIHSHPDEKPHPSKLDMSQQQATALPWAIVGVENGNTSNLEWFGDQTPIQPYLGRQFLSGIRDCWCLVRDWYRKELNIVLDNLPRDWDWAVREVELINDKTIRDTGLYEIEATELRIGDIIAARIGARIVNHTGIYMGRGLVMHHTWNRLSCMEPLNPWSKYVFRYLRHKDA